MKKERDTTLEADVLSQLTLSLEESFEAMKDFYEKKDFEKFNKQKRFVIDIQRKIGELVGN